MYDNNDDFFGPSLGIIAAILAALAAITIALEGATDGAVIHVEPVEATALISHYAENYGESDRGLFEFTFDITATDGDIFLRNTSVFNTEWFPAGTKHLVANTAYVTVSTAANWNANYLVINDGDTEELTLFVSTEVTRSTNISLGVGKLSWGDAPSLSSMELYELDETFTTNPIFLSVLVPEPTSAILAGAGMIIILATRRRHVA